MKRLTTRYTVLLLYPDWMDSSKGVQTFLAHVTVVNPLAAAAAAKQQALVANNPNEFKAEDFRTLLVIQGHYDNLNPES